MNILHDFISATERVGSKAEPVTRRMRACRYGEWTYEPTSQISTCTTGRTINGLPLDLAAEAARIEMGERWVGHEVHAPTKHEPGGVLARVAKRNFEGAR